MHDTTTTKQYVELAELAGGFIHEIKNHLNTLSLHIQLLGEDLEGAETQRERRAEERVDRLTDECRRLLELSNDFLRFARVTELTRLPTDLDALVTRMVDFLTPTARVQNVHLRWHPAPDLPLLPIDVEMFEKVLLNLMLNAQDAMPDGGTLTLQAHACDDRVILHVIDTGCGISEDMLDRVFTPFVTTKADGNGLGLATAKKIVLAHGGSIDVQSAPGRGTMFTISLPSG